MNAERAESFIRFGNRYAGRKNAAPVRWKAITAAVGKILKHA